MLLLISIIVITYTNDSSFLQSNLGTQIIKLIRTPRELKAIEREVREKWDHGLKGEISWYDLLLISALKISEPRVYEWIMRESEFFIDGKINININIVSPPSDEEKAEAKDKIKNQIKEFIGTKTEDRIEVVLKVLTSLFPRPAPEPDLWSQKISLKYSEFMPGISYFRRYFLGVVPDGEIKDQPTLKYINKIKKNGFESTEFERRYLGDYGKMTNDLNRFVQFSGLLDWTIAKEVCDCMLNWMCDRKHWSIWSKQEDCVPALMPDIKQILDYSAQFEFKQARKNGVQDLYETGEMKKWIEEKLRELVSKDVVVAIRFVDYAAKSTLGENEPNTLLGNVIKEQFLKDEEVIWEKVKGHRYYLLWVLNKLKFNQDYENIRDKITQSIVKKIASDTSNEFIGSVIVLLVGIRYPAGRPDLIDGYEFFSKKDENQEMYNMEILLPALAKKKGLEFKDPVSAKAYDFLMKEYEKDLRQQI